MSNTLEYDFLAPPRIVFGWGRMREAGTLAATLGRRAFVIHGSRTLFTKGILPEIIDSLEAAGVRVVSGGHIYEEPQVADVDRMAELLRHEHAGAGDLLVAVGGGSAIDLAKAAGAIVTQPGHASVRDYLEGVGRGLTLTAPPLPLLAMPTTAGTGTEATKNAVISCYDPPFKKSLRSALMVPRAVLVDPELSVSVPPATTAYTGMDAITQLIESYLTRKPRPIAQALALEGLAKAGPAIVEAYRDGHSRPAREAMSHAALLSGMALANSGLGMAHGVAAALGVHCRVRHGLACAVMLPATLRVNREVRQAELAKIGEILTGRTWPSAAAAADAAIEHVDGLCAAVGIPRRLSEIGVAAADLPALVTGSRGNSMNGNPRDVSDEELGLLLERML